MCVEGAAAVAGDDAAPHAALGDDVMMLMEFALRFRSS